MAIDTKTEVSELKGVVDEGGSAQPPRSDNYTHLYGTDRDVYSDPVSQEIPVPARADSIRALVTGWNGSGLLILEWTDEDGNTIVKRGPSDNPDYDSSTSDGTAEPAAVFIDTAAVGPRVRVKIQDTSGAENVVNFSVYAR